MNAGKINNRESKENCFTDFRVEYYVKHLLSLSGISTLLLILLFAANAYPQDSGFFNVRSIIRDVQSQFKLKKSEIRGLKPLIVRENEDVVRIYSRFSREGLGFSSPLWEEVIKRRLEFESRLSGRLTDRQRSAMRAARTALEARVLSFLVDDYVFFLGDFLELNGLELEGVQVVFQSEFRKKHILIADRISRSDSFQTELEKISEETERNLKMILSPEQFRDYRSLSGKDDNFIS